MSTSLGYCDPTSSQIFLNSVRASFTGARDRERGSTVEAGRSSGTALALAYRGWERHVRWRLFIRMRRSTSSIRTGCRYVCGSVRGVGSEGGSFSHTSIMKSPTGGWERTLHRSRSRAPRDLARFPEWLTLDPPANPPLHRTYCSCANRGHRGGNMALADIESGPHHGPHHDEPGNHPGLCDLSL
jgi:hypothetical protein